jgi:hypothetical protein
MSRLVKILFSIGLLETMHRTRCTALAKEPGVADLEDEEISPSIGKLF